MLFDGVQVATEKEPDDGVEDVKDEAGEPPATDVLGNAHLAVDSLGECAVRVHALYPVVRRHLGTFEVLECGENLLHVRQVDFENLVVGQVGCWVVGTWVAGWVPGVR